MSDGTRTRGHLDHNQVLYQLSYTHHAQREVYRLGPDPGNPFARGVDQTQSTGGGAGVAPVSDPWCRAATIRAEALSSPGGGRKTDSR